MLITVMLCRHKHFEGFENRCQASFSAVLAALSAATTKSCKHTHTYSNMLPTDGVIAVPTQTATCG